MQQIILFVGFNTVQKLRVVTDGNSCDRLERLLSRWCGVQRQMETTRCVYWVARMIGVVGSVGRSMCGSLVLCVQRKPKLKS